MGRATSLVLLLLGTVCGCHRGAPRLVEIRFVESSTARPGEVPVQPLPIDRQATLRRVVDEVQRDQAEGHLYVALGERPRPGVDWRLTLELSASVAPSPPGSTMGHGDGLLCGYVAARLEHVDAAPSEPPIEYHALAERDLPAGAPPDPTLVRAHLERAVDDVVRALLPLYVVHRADLDALLATLRDPRRDPMVRAEAIQVVAERRLRGAVPALIGLLASDDQTLRDRALGALVAIGDRRAVKPVTRLARFDDTANLPKVIDALGSLGGGEARAYLEFIVSGHDDPDMRELARDALRRLDQHSGRPPSEAVPGRE